MVRYLIARLQHLAWVILVVTALVFLLIHLSGDPVTLLAPLDASPEDWSRVARMYDLDKPVWHQYLLFVSRAVRGDLGQSFTYGTDALTMVVGRLPATLTLAVSATILTVVVAIPVGVKAAARPESLFDWVASGLSFLAISIPAFWLGIMLILTFSDYLRWLPPSGRSGWQSLILPTISLSMFNIGLFTRLARNTVMEALRQDYIRTARGKGLSESVVLYRHALRNSLIPLSTVLGLQFGTLLGGSVVIENVFAWPGVGWIMLQGIGGRDIPLVRAVVLLVGLFFVAINLAVDLLYGYLDPRIRYEG